jgi:hypothetical protein
VACKKTQVASEWSAGYYLNAETKCSKTFNIFIIMSECNVPEGNGCEDMEPSLSEIQSDLHLELHQTLVML